MKQLLRNMSIRAKVTAMIVLASTGVLVLALTALLTKDYLIFRADQLEQLMALGRVVGANSSAAVAFGDREAAEESLATLATTPNIEAAFLWTDDATLASYSRRGSGWAEELLTDLQRTATADQGIRGERGDMFVRVPVVLDGETIGQLWVVSDLSRLNLRIREYVWIGLGVLGSAILVALLVSFLLGIAISKPLSNLTVAMRGIEKEKQYSSRVTKLGNDEVGQLIDSFNAMLEQIELRDRKLRQHRNELEQQVQARTQELVQTNASLWQAVSDLEEAKSRAEAANKAKSEFLATVSHEIRTPLNGVLGTTEVLLSTELSDKQRRFGQIIHGSAKTLLGIINTILDFSKIEAGKIDLEVVNFDPREIIEEVQELFLEMAEKKGLRFGAHVAPHLPRLVTGDPGRLRQILTNLTGNAMKFTEQGEVMINARPEEITADSILLRVEVRDTGIGVPRAARERIFESFAQADQSTTRRYGGTGLGLTIAKQLARMMGGTIGLESEPGVGSTFWFTVRLASAQEVPVDETRRSILNGIRALVVHGDPSGRESFLAQLAALGIGATGTGSEDEAMSLLQAAGRSRQPFDAAFIDLGAAHDAPWLVRAMRADTAVTPTRVVLLASMHDDADKQAAQFPAGCERLLKPVRQSALYDCLSTTIRAKTASASGPAAAAADETLHARVLLAEDNPVNREVAGEALRQIGCEVDSAVDGRQAVEMWTKQRYDMILMDCHMPHMDGMEAAAVIRKREAMKGDGTRTPILALTANVRGEDYDKCIAAGMDDYLTKPLTLNELRAALGRWLNPGQPAPAAETPAPAAAAEPVPAAPAPEAATAAEPVIAAEPPAPEIALPPAAPEIAAPVAETPPAEPIAAAEPSSAAEPVDIADALDTSTIDYLRTLRRGEGPTVLERAIGMYLENAPAALDELRRSIAAGDASAVWKIAHGLKSSSASLGAKGLALKVGEMEGRARQNDLAEATARLVYIETEYRKVSAALQATLREEQDRCRQIA